MFELKRYCRAKSLEQADALLHEDKKNVILGGLLWMRLGSRSFETGIDLTGLSLDRIEEKDDCVEIGAMTCLRQMETSALLAAQFGPMIRQAVSGIVGVQFRNLATVGGSVYSRFSFSDVATALLALDAKVHLYRGGVADLGDFLDASPGRDILVKIAIPKPPVPGPAMVTCFQSIRKSATDFPVLAAAFRKTGDHWRIAFGARPSRAKLALETAKALEGAPQDLDQAGAALVREMAFGSDARGSRAYREHLAQVLLRRGAGALC